MMKRAVIECLDRHAYVIGILVVPCDRSEGKAVCDIPRGPQGTESRIVYLPSGNAGSVFALLQDDAQFDVTTTWVKGNEDLKAKEFSFNEYYLLASTMLDGERIVLDLTRGSGWHLPENIAKYGAA